MSARLDPATYTREVGETSGSSPAGVGWGGRLHALIGLALFCGACRTHDEGVRSYQTGSDGQEHRPASVGVGGQDAGKHLAWEDVRRIVGATPSPNGALIAMGLVASSEGKATEQWLGLLDVERSHVTLIAPGDHFRYEVPFGVSWTPDSEGFAYTAISTDMSFQTWVRWIGKSEQLRIPWPEDGIYLCPQFSPDGSMLIAVDAVTHCVGLASWEANKPVRSSLESGVSGIGRHAASWSPDAHHVYVVRDTDLADGCHANKAGLWLWDIPSTTATLVDPSLRACCERRPKSRACGGGKCQHPPHNM